MSCTPLIVFQLLLFIPFSHREKVRGLLVVGGWCVWFVWFVGSCASIFCYYCFRRITLEGSLEICPDSRPRCCWQIFFHPTLGTCRSNPTVISYRTLTSILLVKFDVFLFLRLPPSAIFHHILPWSVLMPNNGPLTPLSPFLFHF